MDKRKPYIDAISKEIIIRSEYISKENISTIYFGGGTPSQLSIADFSVILNTIYDNFEVDHDVEITLEANPDDVNIVYLEHLKNIGFNRISIGIQTFDDQQLAFLNRRHSSQKAIDAVMQSQYAGFNNISIDLMYGLPHSSIDIWQKNLETAISLDIQHISSYHLIYEEGTKLFRMLENGEVRSLEEELSIQMFTMLIETLNEAKFIHYEISNFGKEGYFSRHNSSYWLGSKYLGLGPSAHSFNGVNRCWNISSIPQYIKGVEASKPFLEEEFLDTKTRYNDFILTGLRTIWGVDSIELKDSFGDDFLRYFEDNISKHIQANNVSVNKSRYTITRQGIFISDSIMSDLMYID